MGRIVGSQSHATGGPADPTQRHFWVISFFLHRPHWIECVLSQLLNKNTSQTCGCGVVMHMRLFYFSFDRHFIQSEEFMDILNVGLHTVMINGHLKADSTFLDHAGLWCQVNKPENK